MVQEILSSGSRKSKMIFKSRSYTVNSGHEMYKSGGNNKLLC